MELIWTWLFFQHHGALSKEKEAETKLNRVWACQEDKEGDAHTIRFAQGANQWVQFHHHPSTRRGQQWPLSLYSLQENNQKEQPHRPAANLLLLSILIQHPPWLTITHHLQTHHARNSASGASGNVASLTASTELSNVVCPPLQTNFRDLLTTFMRPPMTFPSILSHTNQLNPSSTPSPASWALQDVAASLCTFLIEPALNRRAKKSSPFKLPLNWTRLTTVWQANLCWTLFSVGPWPVGATPTASMMRSTGAVNRPSPYLNHNVTASAPLTLSQMAFFSLSCARNGNCGIMPCPCCLYFGPSCFPQDAPTKQIKRVSPTALTCSDYPVTVIFA